MVNLGVFIRELDAATKYLLIKHTDYEADVWLKRSAEYQEYLVDAIPVHSGHIKVAGDLSTW